MESDINIISTNGFFGKAKAIRNYRKMNCCNISEIIYIGDEVRDIKACNKVGVDIIFVKWGLDQIHNGNDLKIAYAVSSPDEILSILKTNS
jgi:phosphoglycolate phosphatase